MRSAKPALSGKAIMVVEDEYLIAINIEKALEELGARIVGPFSRVEDALDVLKADGFPDAAILDINVRGRPVFPVAERLRERNVPFVFATGYDHWAIPPGLAHIHRFEKPADPEVLGEFIAGYLAEQDSSGVA